MKVVNKNVESKGKILEYLKNINVDSSNIHEDFDFDNYIVSIVMITINATTSNCSEDDYYVYILIQDKKDDKILGKYLNNKFVTEHSANAYYNELKDKIKSFSNKDLEEFLK